MTKEEKRFIKNVELVLSGSDDPDLKDDIMFDANCIVCKRKEFLGKKVSELYTALKSEVC